MGIEHASVDNGYNDLVVGISYLLPAGRSVDRQRLFGVSAAVVYAVAVRVLRRRRVHMVEVAAVFVV